MVDFEAAFRALRTVFAWFLAGGYLIVIKSFANDN